MKRLFFFNSRFIMNNILNGGWEVSRIQISSSTPVFLGKEMYFNIQAS